MLTLPIKGEWFRMIKSGEKKEEYREIKPFYIYRFEKYMNQDIDVKFRNGYRKDSPVLITKVHLCKGIGLLKWGAEKDVEYYILKIISILE